MPNLGSPPGGGSEVSRLRLFASSSTPTKATITFTATGRSVVVQIPTPDVSVTIDLNKLFGSNLELADISTPSTADEVSRRSFHIVADDEISLYGVNIRAKSADAFLGLPQDVLGLRHVVLAWPNGYERQDHVYDTPSQFAVVATEDSTVLQVTPPDEIGVNWKFEEDYTIFLNAGDVYLAQALTGSPSDLSGTEVQSNKPVAVFAGVKRSAVPVNLGNNRDQLVEQLPPLEAWGREALVTPAEQMSAAPQATAVFRVAVPFNNTHVTVTEAGGTFDTTFLLPGILERPITGPAKVTADKSVLVVHYEHSANLDGSPNLGDPFSMIIPPAEQFDTSYTFQCIVDDEFPADLHFINIVIPQNATGSIRLDGAPVTAAWKPIPGSDFGYLTMRVDTGSHQIRADSAFGLYVYGYGTAVSYGYPGGLLFRRLIRDYDPPRLQSIDTCGGLTMLALDDRISDLGIVTCEPLPTSTNVNVVVPPFPLGADTVRVSARLVDPYQDGLVALRVVDSAGSESTRTIAVPGFTVRVIDTASNTTPATLEPLVHYNNGQACRTIRLRNYGAFTQTIDRASLLPGAPIGTVNTPLPILLYPGRDTAVEICFTLSGDTSFPAQISIAGACATREVALVTIENRVDTVAPHDSLATAPCGDDVILVIDDGGRGSGVGAVAVDTVTNGSGRVLENLASVPLRRTASVMLHRTDPRRDLIYRLVVTDGSGNVRIMEDTLGGFTVATTDPVGIPVSLEVGTPRTVDSFNLGVERCDTVLVANTGLRTLVINGGRARGNIFVSLPPSQFPIVVLPGEERALTVCGNGDIAGLLIDTLDLLDECGHIQSIEYNGGVRVEQYQGTDDCGTVLGLTTTAAGKRTVFVAATPAREQLHLFLGSPEAQEVTAELVSLDGSLSGAAFSLGTIAPTIHTATLPLGTTPAGLYLCRLRTSDGKILGTQQVIVVK